MTSGRVSKAIAAGILLAGLGAGMAHAGDEQVKARQEYMKANGAMAGLGAKILKGEQPYDAAAVKAAIDDVMAKGKIANDLKAWDPGSNDGATIKSYLKPEAWSDPEGFGKVYEPYAKGVQAVAASTDEASFKTAFAEYGGSCKGCHEKYRLPKE
jgi:cytochrome c556